MQRDLIQINIGVVPVSVRRGFFLAQGPAGRGRDVSTPVIRRPGRPAARGSSRASTALDSREPAEHVLPGRSGIKRHSHY